MAADQHAIHWREVMQKRYPDDHVRIEPAPDAEVTFPVGEEDEDEKIELSRAATIRCPHCHGFIDAMPPVI